jgi:hypothetical protein
MNRKGLALALILFISHTAIVSASGPSASSLAVSLFQAGRIEVTVLDPAGARISGAVVTLRTPAGASVSQARTDGEGRFSFNDVAAGRYVITVEAPGFSQPGSLALTVGAGKTEAVTVRLEVAQITDQAPVSARDSIYLQIRTAKLGGEYADVNNLVLARDVCKNTLKSGAIYFLPPVEGRVTGGVFIGEGELQMTPVLLIEQKNLSIFTGGPSITEQFNKMVLRFTDSTYDEIKKQAGVKTGPANSGAQSVLDNHRNLLRKGKAFGSFSSALGLLHYNLDARIFMDVMRPHSEGLFMAYFNGKRYGDMLFGIDPLGAPFVTPEEVVLASFNENTHGIWVASHVKDHYRTTAVFDENHQLIDIEHYKIEATVKGKRLEALAQARIKALADGPKVLPFDLFSRLRMIKITDDKGRDLGFIQEEKNEDADFYVVLREPVKKGQTYTLTFQYAGNDAVSDSGGGNYTLDARSNWYPSSYFGDRATYEMTLKVAKGLTMVATGQPAGERVEGDLSITDWKSDVPLAVAGFNYGKFKKTAAQDEKTKYAFESYANKEIPDYLKDAQQASDEGEAALGVLNTTSMMDKARAEAQLSVSLFSEMFGPLPYGRIAMTQQPYFSFGQAWPMLVYMPLIAYLDSTVRHEFGLDGATSFIKIVGPHEVAHQWWGHVIGWKSYRDQWMSEGFAHCSAAIFAQYVYKNDLFVKFWREQREEIMEKNHLGKRPADIGGVYMGYRLNTPKTGDIAQSMIYPKGGFIMHMLRMMMWEPKTGDQRFIAMMKDFVKTHHNQNVSTLDFQRAVERHMTKEMDMDGNGKMNWFFSQWVYGTSVPDYKLDYRIEPAEGGKFKLICKLTQSNVTDDFKMRVPIYLEMGGKVSRLGSVGIEGNTTTEELQVILPQKPKKAMLCYYEDVLCTTGNR